MKNQRLIALLTNHRSIFRHLPFILFLILFPGMRVRAQFPVCNDMVFVSVDGACSANLLPDQILEGGPYNYPDYLVELDKDGGCNGPWLPATLNNTDINQTYCVRVTYTVNGVSCTGTVKVEDKLPPVMNCPPDQTIPSAATTWLPVGEPGLSPGTVYSTALAFSGTTPYVAFQDNVNGGKATVMKFNGAHWGNVGPPNFSAGGMNYIALAFSGTTPYVAYQDYANGGKATVMRFNGTNWVNVGSPGFSAGQAEWVSLAFSGTTPYVAYKDHGNSTKATVMKFNGTGWVNVGTAGFSAGQVEFTSLAFSGVTPYLAYKDHANGTKASVMKFDGTNWVNVGTAGFSAGQAEWIALAFSGTTPYVAHTDFFNANKATVMKFDGANWVSVGTPGFSAGPAYSISLAFSGTTPFIAYTGNAATVMKFDGANWVNVGMPAFSAGQVNYTDLAFSGTTPYMSYSDGANGNKATVMQLVSTNCNAPLGDWTGMGSATDNCAGPVPFAQTPAAGTLLSYGNLQTTVRFTAGDNNGNTSSCTFKVTLSLGETCDGYDNDCNGVIDEGCPIVVSGRIFWSGDNATGVNGTSVKLSGSATPPVVVTSTNGAYGFNTGLFSGNFTIKPTKNTNKLNGVTVADFLAVQQHVGNAVPITDPYKIVAADVNQSNSVTGLDASLINLVLLGSPAANAVFNTSWRFVPFSYFLSIPPWGFPEKIDLTGITSTQPYQDFIGIKLGDVAAAFANPVNFGNPAGESLAFRVEDRLLQTGASVEAEFRAGQFDDLTSFQFALRFDPEQLQLVDIEPLAALPITTDHFGTYYLAEGEIRVVWAQLTSMALSEAAPVFRLHFKALTTGAKLSEVLQLDDEVLPGYAYNTALTESGVELMFTETTGTDHPAGTGLQLYQNRPNPFNRSTSIGFFLPEGCEAQLRVFDVSGRMLAERKANYAAGKQEEIFDLDGAAGVLYYELVTPAGTMARKMAAIGQ